MTRSGRQFAGALRGPVEPGRARRRRRGPGPRGRSAAATWCATSIPAVGELSQFPSARVLLDAWTSTLAHVRARARRGPRRRRSAPRRGELAARGRLGPRCARCSSSALLPVGILGAWRLARPIGSLRAGVAAVRRLRGRPGALQRARPRQLGRPGRLRRRAVGRSCSWPGPASSRPSGAATSPTTRPRPRPRRPRGRCPARSSSSASCWPLAASFLPFVVVLGLVTAVALALGSLVAGRPGGAGRMLAVGGRCHRSSPACCTCRGRATSSGPAPAGTCSPAIGSTDGGDLVRRRRCCASRPVPSAASLGYALLVAAALPAADRAGVALRVGGAGLVRGPRRVGARAGSARRAGSRRRLPPARGADRCGRRPGSRSATALGMAAFEVDLPGYRFGWRQAVSLGGGARGARRHPPAGLGHRRRPLEDARAATSTAPWASSSTRPNAPPGRVLWVGRPRGRPGRRVPLRRPPDVRHHRGPARPSRTGGPRPSRSAPTCPATRCASRSSGARAGSARLLAPMGVQYIVVPNRNAPSAYSGVSRPAARDPPLARWPSSSTSRRSRATCR